jgi:hypothetical protein
MIAPATLVVKRVVAHVMRRGPIGPSGLLWRNDAWEAGKLYVLNAALFRNGSSYRALLEHQAAAATEPGVGLNWRAAWSLIAAEGAAATVTVGEVRKLAPNAPAAVRNTGTDREAIFEIDLPSGAPAIEQGEITTLLPGSQATATLREIGEAAYALDLGLPAGAPGIVGREYPVSVYKSDGSDIAPQGYTAARRVRSAGTLNHFFAEVTHGAGSVEVSVLRNGDVAYGPVRIAAGAPVIASGLALVVAAGDTIDYMVTTVSAVSGLWVQLDGAET